MKKYFYILVLFVLSCNYQNDKQEIDLPQIPYDSHVHIMSPQLVETWKAEGIPFSKPSSFYQNIDTIYKYVKADTIDLIGMAYVYGGSGLDKKDKLNEYELVKSENDFLHEAAEKYPGKVRSFFAADPLKEYALPEFQRCHHLYDVGGLKLHFSASQVYLTVPEHVEKVKPIFQFAAEKELPVLVHFDNWHPKFGEPDIRILVDSILADCSPLTIRIAHFGTSGGFSEKTREILDIFIRFFNENKISKRHRILFDLSAVALDKDSEGVSKLSDEDFNILSQYIKKLGTEKILFGTDYPLYRADEYYNILKSKLALSETELQQILNNR